MREYDTLEGVYENIDNIKGSVHDKLVSDKKQAFMSKEMVTIDKYVPLDISFDDIKYMGPDNEKLKELYSELEFHKFLKEIDNTNNINKKSDKLEVKIIEDMSSLELDGDISLWLELDNENYHLANIRGISICDGNNIYYVDKDNIDFKVLSKCNIYTYDAKKLDVILFKNNVDKLNIVEDVMICGYLLNYNVKDDIAYLSNNKGYDLAFYDSLVKKGIINVDIEEFKSKIGEKSLFIYNTYDLFLNELHEEDMEDLFKRLLDYYQINEDDYRLLTMPVNKDNFFEGHYFKDMAKCVDVVKEAVKQNNN